MKRSIMIIAVVGLGLLGGLSGAAYGGSLFFDDFESGLGQWTGKGGGAHHAQIVADPLDATNQVINFTQTAAGGDIFQSLGLTTTASQPLVLSFDYLGVGAGQSGGYIGISGATDAQHFWLAGTGNTSGASPILTTTGQWQHVEIAFNTPYTTTRVMIEDFVAPAYNAYFDNITVATPMPAPAAILAGPVLLGLVGLQRKRG